MNNFKPLVQFAIVTSLAAFSFACSHKRSQDIKPPNDPTTNQKNQCDELKKNEQPRPTVLYTSRAIERHFQRTVRLSCEGRVISDGIETVKNPWGKLNIYPQIKVTNPKNPGVWEIKNRKTCNGGGFRYLDNMNTGIRVWLDIARAVLTFEVVPGRNIIDYDFSVCENYDTQNKTQCLKFQYEEKGSVVLDVEYKEVTLPGIREIKESCPTRR